MRDFVIKYVLKPNGYEHLEARDGLEGLEQIETKSPDLVLLDLQMPRLDGLGLLRRLRENEINIPVVLMTFYGSEEIAIEVFRLGVRDYVIKPFTEDELLAAVERGLVETRLRRQRDILRRVGKYMARLPEVDALLLYVLEAEAELTGVPQGAILLIGESGQGLVARATMIKGKAIITSQPVQNALAWQAVQTARPVAGQSQTDSATGHTVIPVFVPMI